MEVRIQAIHFDATERLQDFIQKKTSLVEDPAADLVLRGALVPGDTLQVSVSQGKVTVRPVSPK